MENELLNIISEDLESYIDLFFSDSNNILDFLRNSFNWFESIEGYTFWYNVNRRYKKYITRKLNEEIVNK